jgi:hypothetical protein
MHWGKTRLFLHLELEGTSPLSGNKPKEWAQESFNHTTKATITRETQRFFTGVQPHTLRSTSPLRSPQRVNLYTYVTFLPLATTKIELELLTQSWGNTNFLGQSQTFGCSKSMPSRLGAQSSKSNKHESYQPSEERGALDVGNQLTSTLQALTLNPSLNIQQISPNQVQGE